MVDAQRIPRACTGRFPAPARLALLRTMLVDPGNFRGRDVCEVDWVQGSFLLVRTDLWHSLGGLDERYFMYVEDVDLCKRALDSGFKCALLTRMRYVHIGGFSSSRFPNQIANLAFYVEQHTTGLQKLCCRSSLLIGCVARVGLYQLRAILLRDDASRNLSHVCRQALGKLLSVHAQSKAGTVGVGL